MNHARRFGFPDTGGHEQILRREEREALAVPKTGASVREPRASMREASQSWNTVGTGRRSTEPASRTEAPVFGTASGSSSSRRKICSWPPVSGNPNLRAWFILPGVVRTASVAGSSPGAEETLGATDNDGYRVPSGGSSTRPIILAAATPLPRPATHDYVTARTLAVHHFPD
ncbi:hypothetical protein HPB52_014985 [Rhipicephalus sanguineus]|uniref:Uncharacterized protein n=1 Tax=Rhipicephalus sanguineus TaxID=34632 RepID=A0A9D4Q0G6_RHISA|nr:hypothetical protein HPB52_014985 [Rhipicephalus sanguineus]